MSRERYISPPKTDDSRTSLATTTSSSTATNTPTIKPIAPQKFHKMPQGFPALMHPKYRSFPTLRSMYPNPSTVPENVYFPTRPFSSSFSSSRLGLSFVPSQQVPSWCHPSRFVRQWVPTNHIQLFDTYIFDIDGVLCKSGRFFPGVISTLQFLSTSLQKRLLFATNNATAFPEQIAASFKYQGLEIPVENIVSAGAVAVWHLKQYVEAMAAKQLEQVLADEKETAQKISSNTDLDFEQNTKTEHRQQKNAIYDKMKQNPPQLIYYGPKNMSLCRALQHADINVIPFNNASEMLTQLSSPDWLIQQNIVGFVSTSRQPISRSPYENQQLSQILSQHNIRFFITSPDVYIPCSRGSEHRYDISAMCEDHQCPSHRLVTLLGKPNTHMIDYLSQKYHINPHTTLMIGDGMIPDILFGKKQQFSTLLVTSGNVSMADFIDFTPYFIENSPDPFVTGENPQYYEQEVDEISHMCKPDFIAASVTNLLPPPSKLSSFVRELALKEEQSQPQPKSIQEQRDSAKSARLQEIETNSDNPMPSHHKNAKYFDTDDLEQF